MFDGPQRAIRCAMSIGEAVQALGIEVRAGLHTGECEIRGDDIGGIAVHIGARVSAWLGLMMRWCPARCATLVIGSGLESEARGPDELKGVPVSAPLRRRRYIAVGFGTGWNGGGLLRSAMRSAAKGSLRRRWSAMSLARCWVRVCLRRGIISPRLVVSLPWRPPVCRV